MKKIIFLFSLTFVFLCASSCGRQAISDSDENTDNLQVIASSEEKAPEAYYDIAVYTLTDYYERIYTGKEKARFIKELRTEELDAYVEEQILSKQKNIRVIGGYVKDLELVFNQESVEESDEKIVLTVNVEASFHYPGVTEESGFGAVSVFELKKQNDRYVLTSWKMPDPPNDDFDSSNK